MKVRNWFFKWMKTEDFRSLVVFNLVAFAGVIIATTAERPLLQAVTWSVFGSMIGLFFIKMYRFKREQAEREEK